MTKETKKTLATILAVSMIFSNSAPNNNIVVALPPEPLKLVKQEDNVRRLKKK